MMEKIKAIFSHYKKIFYYSLLISAGVLLGIIINYFEFVEQERYLYDLSIKISGQKKPDGRIVLILTRDELFRRYKLTNKIPLGYYVASLEQLKNEQPKVIGFDINISNYENETRDLEALSNISKDLSSNVIFASDIIDDEFVPIPKILPNSKRKILYIVARQGTMTKDHLKASRYTYGFYEEVNDKYSTLDIEIASRALNKDLFYDSRMGKPFYIRYAGPKGTYKTYNFEDILAGNFKKGEFKDKIIIIGRGDELTYDHYHKSPFHRKNDGMFCMTRSEIHANIIDTIINNRIITYAPNYITLILTIIFSILTIFLVFSLRPINGIILIAVELVLIICSVLILYNIPRLYINTFQPILSIFITYYFFIPYRLIVEYKNRWKIQEEMKINKEVQELKLNFLSLISHDLKTPIAKIQGFLETLLLKNYKEEARKGLENILFEVEKISGYVSRLLNITKIEAKQIKIKRESHDVNEIIDEVINSYNYMARLRKIEIVQKLEPLFPIKVDSYLIKEILKNLIDNAIKYSFENTNIEISSEEKKEEVIVKIKDNGLGISKEDHKNIFEKFYRIKDGREKMTPGSGLGLYLSQYFATLHKGKITFDSEKGKGSVFRLHLPIE
jgi:signal transduction histidine kinase